MTNELSVEEAIKMLKSKMDGHTDTSYEWAETVRMAIKALEQQPKMGRWNRVIDKAGHWVWECDKCSWQQRFNTNFCPDCGADMAESEGE